MVTASVLRRLLDKAAGKEEMLKVEQKKVARQKKKAKIRSSEYYELQTYEYLLASEVKKAIQSRVKWQQQIQQAMIDTDIAFVLTMIAEAR
jgi:hypothetical protein